MTRPDYVADIVASRKPPKVIQRHHAPQFPGVVTVAFRWPGRAKKPGGIVGFGITTTASDSGQFGEEGEE